MVRANRIVEPSYGGTSADTAVPGHLDSDAAVIRRSLDDPGEFGEIFDRHFDAIWGFAVSRVGREDGADIASQVFTLAFERRQRFDLDYESARPWLFGIAGNLIRRRHRSQARGSRAVSRLSGSVSGRTEDHAAGVVELVDAQARLGAVMAALDELGAADREMLLLYAWDGMSYAEIAATLGIPAGTVRSRLSRGRKKLEELVGQFGQQGVGNP